MALEKPERPIKDLSLVINDENILEIPRDNSIRRIILRFVLAFTNTATSPTFVEDDYLNFIKGIKILRNGSDVKWNLPLRLAYHLETLEKGTKPHKTTADTTVSTSWTGVCTVAIDFAQDRLNENDISALLHTRDLSSLDLVITTGDVNDVASANAPTLDSAKVEVELKEVSGFVTVDNKGIDIQSIPVLDIVEDTREVSLEANHTSFDKDTQEIEITPTPSNILAHALMVTDNSVRSNALLTELKVQKVKGGKKDLIHRSFVSLNDMNKSEFNVENEITGFVLLDWQEKLGRVGFSNTGQKGEHLWRFLTASTVVPADDKVEIYTRSVA